MSPMKDWNEQVSPSTGDEKLPDWKEKLIAWCDERAKNWPRNYIEQLLGVK